MSTLSGCTCGMLAAGRPLGPSAGLMCGRTMHTKLLPAGCNRDVSRKLLIFARKLAKKGSLHSYDTYSSSSITRRRAES